MPCHVVMTVTTIILFLFTKFKIRKEIERLKKIKVEKLK